MTSTTRPRGVLAIAVFLWAAAPLVAQDMDIIGVRPGQLAVTEQATPVRPGDAPPGPPPQQAQSGEPVDTVSGKLFRADVDLEDPGPLVPVVISRYYETGRIAPGPLGWGWRHAYDRTLAIKGAGRVERTGSDGSFVVFVMSGPEAHNGGHRLRAREGGYEEEAPDGARYFYDGEGRLGWVADRSGNRVTLQRDGTGRVVAIGAPGRRVYPVAWEGDRIVRIGAPGERHVAYRYDAAGHLVGVEGPGASPHRYRYDGAHRLTWVGDGRGTFVAYTFDDQGRVATTSDAKGAATRYLYDPVGRKTVEVDPLGQKKTFRYDPRGRIKSIEDRAGQVTHYGYDARGQIARRRFPDGGEATYRHDTQGRLVEVVDPAGRKTTVAYDPRTGQPAHIQAPGGLATKIAYDAAGRPVRVERADGHRVTATYDARGLLTRIEGTNGRAHQITYDDDGQLASWKDPTGRTTRYRFGPTGLLEALVLPGGAMLTYRHDGRGRVVEHVDAHGLKFAISYDAGGNLSRIEAPDGVTSSYTYERIGYADRLVAQVDPLGLKTTYGHDAAGRLSWMEDPQKRRTTFTRDGEGRPVRLVDTSGRTTEWDLDPMGRVLKMARGQSGDPSSRVVGASYTYDPVGRILTEELAGSPRRTFGYDDARRRASVTLAGGQTLTVGHGPMGEALAVKTFAGQTLEGTLDARGQLEKETWVEAGLQARYSYHDGGLLASVVDPMGHETRLAFDRATGLLDHVRRADGSTIRFGYDRFGDLVSETDEADRTTVFERDEHGRIKARVDPMGRRTTYGYDRFGRIVKIEGADGKTTLGYDGLGRLSVMENEHARVTRSYDEPRGLVNEVVVDKALRRTIPFTVRYTEAGEIAWVKLPGDLEIRYDRDALGQVGRIVGPTGEAVVFGRTAARLNVAYPNGVVGIVDTMGGRPSRVIYGRRRKGAGMETILEQAYSYDRQGRMIKLTDSRGAGLTVSHDAMGRIVGYTGARFSGGLSITKAGDRAPDPAERLELDGAGAVGRLERGGKAFVLRHGADGQLREAGHGVNTVKYRHGPMGQRIGRDGEGYLHVGGRLFARYTARGIEEVFLPGDRLDETWGRVDVARRTTDWIHPDPAGSVLALTGPDGQLVASYAYSPFGEMRGRSKKEYALVLGFQGRPYDPVTGLYDFRARSYDPVRGCFTSPDPTGIQAGLNRYAFAGFSPYWRRDPMGLFWEELWEGTKYTFSQVGNFAVGVGEGAWDMVTGIAHVVAHPVDTAKGLWCLATHPGMVVDGLKNYWNTLVDHAYNDPGAFARDMGKLTFNIATFVVPAAGTAKSVSWARGAEMLAEGSTVAKGARVATTGAKLAREAEIAAQGSNLGSKTAAVVRTAEFAETPVSYTYRALRMQGFGHDEAVRLVQQFAKGENPGRAFGFHFTDTKGAQGITQSGEMWTSSGYLGKGVYYGTTPTPSHNLRFFGWGVGPSKQTMIPIFLEDAAKQGALRSAIWPPKAGIVRTPSSLVLGGP